MLCVHGRHSWLAFRESVLHNVCMNARQHRQRWGWMLLGVLLLALVLSPNVRGRTVSGVAVIAPPPGPPSVGDCVSDAIDPQWLSLDTAAKTQGASTYKYPKLGIGRCTKSTYGEVTMVIRSPVVPKVTTTMVDGSPLMEVSDANLNSCMEATSRYVGLTLMGELPAPSVNGWIPSLNVDTAISAPSSRQSSAGQNWLACIVYLHTGGPGALSAIAVQERYQGSIRNTVSTGRLRDRASTCVRGVVFSDAPTGDTYCSQKHTGELLAQLPLTKTPTTRASLQRACVTIVRQLTGIPDRNMRGLAIHVDIVDDNFNVITGALVNSDGFAYCGVITTGGKTLVGGLVGTRTEAIPWG